MLLLVVEDYVITQLGVLVVTRFEASEMLLVGDFSCSCICLYHVFSVAVHPIPR